MSLFDGLGKLVVPKGSCAGQSLVEILVAIAIGALMIIASATIIAPALRTSSQATKVQIGVGLAKELLDNVRAWSEGNWHNIANLATSSANTYYLVTGISPFAVATGTESVLSDGVMSGLVGYWRFDEGAGSSTMDNSGQGKTGVWYGTPAGVNGTYYVAGRVGPWAGTFSGTSTNYVAVPSVNIASGSFTLTGWVELSGSQPQAYGTFMGYDSSHRILVQNGTGLLLTQFGGNFFSSGAISLTQWSYITFVYDASANREYWYINGNYDSSSTPSTAPVWNSAFYIGGYGTTFYPLYGSVDDVRIYNRALSASEISSVYNATVFTRSFYLSDVYRDANGNISGSGQSYDPSTKQVTVVYNWLNANTSTISAYLTRNFNNIYDQTDWSGGPNQAGPVTSTNNKFATSTNIDYTTTSGSIYINLPGY